MEKLTDLNLRNLVKFLKIAGNLKRTPRTGWIDVGVGQPESVADHTFRTALLCMIFADFYDLDSLKLLRMALIHDLPEATIGDLMPSQKTVKTKEQEKKATNQILGLMPTELRENYLAVWKEYQEGKTKEAKTVQQIDKIEMALQAKEYEKLGSSRKDLERFINSAKHSTVWSDMNRLLLCILEEN